MEYDFHYAAHCYLEKWMRMDCGFNQVLGFENALKVPPHEGTKCLVEVATYYKVIRTLRVIEEEPRLKAAYDALQTTRLPKEGNVAEVVEACAGCLCDAYGVNALSAASKFLWMRFRSPVVIYDSIVSKWLCANGTYRRDGYSNYRKTWLYEYLKHEEQIRKVCAELIHIKKFTLARHTSDEKLTEWATSRWFRERVFDHFITQDFDPSILEAGKS
jgi:hypothetical protein